MSKKHYYNIEELERFNKYGLELKYMFQPKWYGFNQHTIENIDFILGALNKTGETPFYQKDVYLMRIAEEVNTLTKILDMGSEFPYFMTVEQVKERMDKLMEVFMKIYNQR